MKIALIILHADPSRGGAERYTLDLAAALAARRHEISLIASTFAPSVPAAPFRPIHLPTRDPTRLGQYNKFLDALDLHLEKERYEIVHAMLPVRVCDVYHPHAGLAVEALATGHEKYDGLRRPLSKIANHLNPKRRRFAAVERRLLKSPNAPPNVPLVICLSEYVKRTVRAHYPNLPDKNLPTLFNAVDLNKFDPAARPTAGHEIRRRFNLSADRIVALMIAQDYQRKGLAEAIQALSGQDPRLSLLVVGKQNHAKYSALARANKVADRVIFAGPTTDPYAFYKAADFFVLPTRHDPCSLVVLEALAMGLPVISTIFNGACEIMTDGVHGYILPDPRNIPSLQSAYHHLTDESLRQKMSQACLELRPRLSYVQHLHALLNIYQAAHYRA